MRLKEWFDKGLTKEQYLEHMQVNKEGMLTIYEGFSLSEEEKETLQAIKQKNWQVIVLTEDWCGDAMINNPVLLKIAEEVEMDVRFVLRDSHLELMDQYLTNGTARAIPIFIFINEAGEEQAVWGPRAPRLQDYVMARREALPAKEDPSFEQAQKDLYKSIGETYQSDPSLWHSVAESIIAKLK